VRIIAQHYKTGDISLLEVPAPSCRAGGVLVRNEFSLISTGTEMMKVGEASMSLLAKARARPDQVAKVVQSASTIGVAATYRKVTSKLDSYTPLGYSLCGVRAGRRWRGGLAVGQRVACGGSQYALPSSVGADESAYPCRRAFAEHAAFTTVGAIAMQGYRQSDARLGETACDRPQAH
jgi:hypothetical protein